MIFVPRKNSEFWVPKRSTKDSEYKFSFICIFKTPVSIFFSTPVSLLLLTGVGTLSRGDTFWGWTPLVASRNLFMESWFWSSLLIVGGFLCLLAFLIILGGCGNTNPLTFLAPKLGNFFAQVVSFLVLLLPSKVVFSQVFSF